MRVAIECIARIYRPYLRLDALHKPSAVATRAAAAKRHAGGTRWRGEAGRAQGVPQPGSAAAAAAAEGGLTLLFELECCVF